MRSTKLRKNNSITNTLLVQLMISYLNATQNHNSLKLEHHTTKTNTRDNAICPSGVVRSKRTVSFMSCNLQMNTVTNS